LTWHRFQGWPIFRMKKVLRILLKIVAGVLLALLIAMAALQSPAVQTKVAERVAESILKTTDADIRFRMISIRPFEAITLDDVAIIDRAPVVEGADTIAWIGSLRAKFSLGGLFAGTGAYVGRAGIEDAVLRIAMEADTLSKHGSRSNLERAFRLTRKQNNQDPTWGKILTARDINLRNVRVIFKDPVNAAAMAKKGIEFGKIDFTDLDVTVENLHARNIKVADNRIILTLEDLRAIENKSGFRICRASAARARVGMDRVRLENFELEDGLSNLDFNRLQLDGRLANYSEFVDSIRVSGDIHEGSVIAMETISYFGPGMEQISFRGSVRGKVDGYVNDILIRDLSAQDLDNKFSVKMTGRVMNATDLQNLALDLKVREARFSLKGLGGFLHAWAPESQLGLDNFAHGEVFTFKGTAKGPLNRLCVNGAFDSALGAATADITVRNTVDFLRPLIVDGGIRTKDLDIGIITGIDALGPLTLGTGLSATIPRDGALAVKIDSLKIDRLQALGYDYSNISAAGSYAEDAFDGRIIAADPNLNFLFQGRFNLSGRTKNQIYRFYASLGYADLHALKLDKRPQSKISFHAFSNFIKTESHDLLGDINISDISLVSSSGQHNLGNISVKAHANDNVHRIKLDSQFLEGSYLGDKAVFNFVNDLRSLVLDKELGALTQDHAPAWDGATYNLNLNVKDARDLLDFLAPGAYIANPTELSLNVDAGGIVTGSVKSGRIALKDKFIKDLDLSLSNQRNVLVADLKGSSVQLGGGVKLLESRLALFANDNRLGLSYSFDNSEQDATKAELIMRADLDRNEDGLKVLARALPSNLYYKGEGWAIASGDILFNDGNLSIDKLNARHDDELLEIDGGYSPTGTDTLSIRMEKFDIGLANTFTGSIFPLAGYASGNAVVISPGSPFPGIEAAIVCDSTVVSGQRMGSLHLGSYWSQEENCFKIDVHNNMDGRSNLAVDASFFPKGAILNADATMDRFNLASAAPVLASVFSTFSGYLSGKVGVSGPLSDINVTSDSLRIADGAIALDFTRALYNFDGPVALDQSALHLNGLSLRDNSGGRATVRGDILINGFKDLGIDIHADLDRIKALDLKKGENPTLYGVLPVSGQLDVKGPMSRIVVDIDATTSGPGDLHLPLGSSSGERERNMLVFTKPADDLQQDPYELMMASSAKQEAEASNLILNIVAHATPEAIVYIDLGDNTLNARGNGTVGVNMETAQNSFGLSGDYTLEQGSFRFSAMNIVSRDFTIQDGSSVRFNGPVNDTDLNVKGLYTTKASLDNLVTNLEGESEDTGGGRRTVLCGIDITGKLLNPELQFSIDIPDLNPTTKMAVESAFSTEDKVQKQFLYLLIAGSFLPEEESGITNTGSDMLFSNVSSIMSGQINNIFDKLNIPLDLGLNYKAQEGRNMFDVAVSTQLFNNRVLVNGAVGNKQKIGSTTSEITGDIDVEVKINKSGTLRTTVFSHSADQFSTYLDNSQRNGVGITYQREFNSIGQFFKELFSPRRPVTGPVPQTTLQIDSTGKTKVIADDKR